MKSPQKKPICKPEFSRKKKGLIVVYTGNGKGKTSAALGAAIRAVGRGMNVCMVQFMKGKWKSGEAKAAEQFGSHFEVISAGEGFTWETQNRERDKALVQKTWALCEEKLASDNYGLLIFDEINYAIDYGYLDLNVVLSALRKKPPMLHVILTGRNAKPKLVAFADLVTEMKEVKHPFHDQQIPAQPGLDF